MPDPTTDHSRVSPAGKRLGASTARLAELGHQRLAAQGLTDLGLPTLRDEMCKSCACRAGTVPNGCMQTQLDFLKAAVEGRPFLCHAPADGRMCAGWARARAELVSRPLPAGMADLLAKHEYSPPDEPTEVADA